MLVEWDEKFSVNIAEIDNQHQKLVELINILHKAMQIGRGKDVLGEVLEGLINYTMLHFPTEENYLKEFSYSGYLRHKKEHDIMTKQALELKKSYDSGGIIIPINVMQILKDWLNKHILETDKEYSEFLNSKGIK